MIGNQLVNRNILWRQRSLWLLLLALLLFLVIGWFWQYQQVRQLTVAFQAQQTALTKQQTQLAELTSEYFLTALVPIYEIKFANEIYHLDDVTAIDLARTVAMFKNYRHWLVTINTNWQSYQGLEEILTDYDIHPDWLYLAAAESFLQQFVRSYVGATGVWQFMSSRARESGLRVYLGWDERRDPRRSTVAAAKQFQRLLQKYDQNMMFVCADWNWGPGALAQILKKSGAEYFFNLPAMPQETYQYVLNILALAYLFKQESDYMEKFDPGLRYQLPETEILEIQLSRQLNVQELLYFYYDSFSLFYVLNTPVDRYYLPAQRTFELYVPKTKADSLANYLKRINITKKLNYKSSPG